MKFPRRHVLLGAAAFGLAGCGSSFAGPSPALAQVQGESTTAPRLFIVNSESGQLVGNRLTLFKVSPEVIWFNDRPARGAGRQPTGRFVAEWQQVNGFSQVPPNAIIQTGSGADSQALVLRSPVWEEDSRTLSFEVALDPGLSASFPAKFGAASLFIDDAGATTSPVTVSGSVLFEVPPGESVTVQLIPSDAPIRFALSNLNFSPDGEARIASLSFDASGQSFSLDSNGNSSQLFLDLVTTSSIQNFALVQSVSPSPVFFQGQPLRSSPTVFSWSGVVVQR